MSEKYLVELVLECIEKCIESWGIDSDVMKRLRTRARTVGSDYFTKGLAYTFTLLAARSSREAIEIGLSAATCKDIVDGIKSLSNKYKFKHEDTSYALYGAIFVYVLKKLGLIKSTTFSDLIKQAMSDPVLSNRAWIIVDWLKRLLEAYVHGD